jgi:hypothetical protein
MKTVFVRSRHGDTKPVVVPETYDEAYEMIARAMNNGMGKGGDSALSSACERAVFGMFGDQIMAPNQRTAMAYLIMRIMERDGAGLDR